MKHLVLGFMFLSLASVAAAQTETDWKTLLTKSGTKVIAVEGATKIDISTAKTLHERGVRFIDARNPWKKALMKIVDKNEEVVFYCDCDIGSASCNLSPKASARAVAWGYQNVYYFTNSNVWSP
ncbi:MAG: hypothetical protein O6950_14725 [Gammaproteobacteria bacterium]|nr:hypothetical protein [Gammaproteobacteria bacterium]